jgi:zinc/manganese transport system permease protein
MNMAADFAWLAAPVAALVAACLVLVPLGSQVLARGVVFIDLAVAQVAACGVLAVGMLVEQPPPWLVALAAAAAALAGSAAVWWLAARWPQQREALIGLVYVAGAGASVIAAASDTHGRERLTALLAADVLWAPWPGVLLLWVAAVAVLLLARRGGLLARDRWFYPLFALALSAAVPVLGLYLVFALLIGPALWTRRGAGQGSALLLGLAACLLGLGLSWALDWPSGACVAVALCALGIASGLRRPPGGEIQAR